jgi:hypothetical protein
VIPEVIDAHMHVPRLSTVSDAWFQWAVDYSKGEPWREVFDAGGDPVPARLVALLDAQRVRHALLFAEYSPRTTGLQPAEDLLPLIEHSPDRFSLVANVNPDVHENPAKEAKRQLAMGAVAVKVHAVHGGFDPAGPGMYQVYELCAARGVPVVTHTGPSIFPGSQAERGHPEVMAEVADRFPGMNLVLAHGGRGHWYAEAASMALARANVWLDVAGLPPKRMPAYYAGFDLERLAAKWIFGTDWPGVPGIAANATAIGALGLSAHTLAGVLSANARRVYLPNLTDPAPRPRHPR